MGLAYSGEDLQPWLTEFRRITPHIRSALAYLKAKNPTFQEPVDKVLNLIEV
jgi:hypothetical protein